MTDSEKTANIVLSPHAQMEAHQEAIRPLWDEAFQSPVVNEYRPGDIVWMFDHYNTARIIGRDTGDDGGWLVETSDADGAVQQYAYPVAWLRPAKAEMVFRWPEVK